MSELSASIESITLQQIDFRLSLESYKKYNYPKEEFLNATNLKTIQQLEFQYEVESLKRKTEIQQLRNDELLR